MKVTLTNKVLDRNLVVSSTYGLSMDGRFPAKKKQLIEDIDGMLLADSFSNPSEKVKKGNMKKKRNM